MLRMGFVIQMTTRKTFRFDPSWYSPTTAGLSCLEVHVAAICAALPVFWPVLTTNWGRIFVTTEVSVTRESAQMHPKTTNHEAEVELHSVSSRRGFAIEGTEEGPDPGGWQPYVGDHTNLGENETLVQAPPVAPSGKWRDPLGCLSRGTIKK